MSVALCCGCSYNSILWQTEGLHVIDGKFGYRRLLGSSNLQRSNRKFKNKYWIVRFHASIRQLLLCGKGGRAPFWCPFRPWPVKVSSTPFHGICHLKIFKSNIHKLIESFIGLACVGSSCVVKFNTSDDRCSFVI